MAKVIVKKSGKRIQAKSNKRADGTGPGKAAFKSDTVQTALLIKAGRQAAAKAIKTSKALGLPITFMEKGVLYEEQADGRKEIIQIKPLTVKGASKPSRVLKKGMILYAKKN